MLSLNSEPFVKKMEWIFRYIFTIVLFDSDRCVIILFFFQTFLNRLLTQNKFDQWYCMFRAYIWDLYCRIIILCGLIHYYISDIIILIYMYKLQIADMRWGVREDATDDHRTTDICLHEISNCQRVSRGPNFVVSLCIISIYHIIHLVFNVLTNVL